MISRSFSDGADDRLEPLRRVTERGLVDALIIADTMRRDPRVDYLTKLNKPCVTFGRTESSVQHAWIDPDFEGAVEGAVQRLASWGIARSRWRCRICQPTISASSGEATGGRCGGKGFAWTKPGICAGRRACGAASRPLRLCSRPIRGRLRLISDSMHAVAFYRRLGKAGMLPGRDISIIGLLPETRAQSLIPALTSYETDWTGIGGRLGDAVIRRSRTRRASESPGTSHPGKPQNPSLASRCRWNSGAARAFTGYRA